MNNLVIYNQKFVGEESFCFLAAKGRMEMMNEWDKKAGSGFLR